MLVGRAIAAAHASDLPDVIAGNPVGVVLAVPGESDRAAVDVVGVAFGCCERGPRRGGYRVVKRRAQAQVNSSLKDIAGADARTEPRLPGRTSGRSRRPGGPMRSRCSGERVSPDGSAGATAARPASSPPARRHVSRQLPASGSAGTFPDLRGRSRLRRQATEPIRKWARARLPADRAFTPPPRLPPAPTVPQTTPRSANTPAGCRHAA